MFAAELRPVDGAGELVRDVLAAGISVCVASQGSLAKTARSLALTGLDALFAPGARFSAEQVPRGKPHPDLFLLAAARMGFAPAETAVVEDTPVWGDRRAARRDGRLRACRRQRRGRAGRGRRDRRGLARRSARPAARRAAESPACCGAE